MGGLRLRHGRSTGRHSRLHWTTLPGGGTHAITKHGAIFVVLFDTHKRKWTVTDGEGHFVGSAIRKRDAQRIAEDDRRAA